MEKRSQKRWMHAVLGIVIAGLMTLPQFAYTAGDTWEVLTTQRGAYLKRTLSDGSAVELNTDSELTINFTSNQRSMTLARGETFVRANSSDSRPFLMTVGNVSIRALDAVFSLRRLADDAVSVYVATGTVLMHQSVLHDRQTRPAVIHARIFGGNAGRLDSGTMSIELFSATDADCQWSWRRGQICLFGQPLATAVAEVNRYSKSTLIIGDPSLSALQVGGSYDIADIASFTHSLERTFGIVSVEATPGSIILLASCPTPEQSVCHRE